MKLHLPTRLRAAVLACITAVAAIATTVGTGALTTGVAAYTLAVSQAYAENYEYTTADNNVAAKLTAPTAEDTITFAKESGFLTQGGGTINAHAVINQLKLTDGYSNVTYTFTNDVTGTGEFTFAAGTSATNQNYAFTGDVSGYSGDMTIASNKTGSFSFSNQTGTGNITAQNGTVNLNGATVNNASITAQTVNVSGMTKINADTVMNFTNLNATEDAILSVAEGKALTLNGTVSLYTPVMNSGSVTLGDNIKFDLSRMTADEGVYTLFLFNAVDMSSLTAANIVDAQPGCEYVFGADGTITVTIVSKNLTWAGGALTWQDGATIGDGTFAEGDIVNFTTAAADVTLGGDVSSSQVNIEQGVEVTLSGAHTLTANEMNINGTLVLDDATLSSTALKLAGELKLTDAGNIAEGTVIHHEGNAAKVTIVGESVTLTNVLNTADNSYKYSGKIVVADGATLKMGGTTSLGNISNTITVEQGGVLDVNGKPDHEYTFTLNGGSLVNTAGDVGTNKMQIKGLNVTADSVIGGTGQFGVIARGYAGTNVTLNGHTLTKTGTNTVNMVNTTVTAGTLRVEGGALQQHNSSRINCDIIVAGGNFIGDACSMEGDHTLASEGAGGTIGCGITSTGSVTVDTAAGSTLTMSGALTTTAFAKTGEGTLAMTGALTVSKQLSMNYEGALTLGDVTVADGAVLTYGGASTDSVIGLAASALAGNVAVDIFSLSAEQLAAGINLGLAADVETSKLTIGGLSAGDYTIETKNDTLWLKATKAAESDWDTNWGGSVLVTAPATLESLTITEETHLASTRSEATVIGVQLTASEEANNVFGGILNTGATQPATTAKSVWIDVTGGTYNIIGGGNNCVSWKADETSAQSFEGDTHIQLKGGSVAQVIGGNFKDGRSPAFKGSSYISVMEGSNVTGNIIGGNTSAHSETSAFTGDSHIFVYSMLSTNSSNLESLGNAWIIGGSAWIANPAGGTQNFNGSTNVTVDLSDYAGEAATFAKTVVGGNFTAASSSTVQTLTGDSRVTIKGTDAVTFSGWFIGGARASTTGTNTQNGNSELILEGGHFTGNIVGAFYQHGNSTATLSGTATTTIKGGSFSNDVRGGAQVAGGTATVGGVVLNIEGGTFGRDIICGMYNSASNTHQVTVGDTTVTMSDGAVTGNLVGGSRLASGDGLMKNGNISITVSGGSVAANIIGGDYIGGAGSATLGAEIGDITVAVSGGTVKDIYGGSHTVRNYAAATIAQGDVTVSLTGGAVTGDVYVGGSQGGSTKMASKSTTLEIGSGVTLTNGKTLSGGYKTPNASTVAGACTLKFVSEGEKDLSGMVLKDFDTVNVAEAAGVLTIADITRTSGSNAITKTGAGTLTLGADFTADSVTVSEGTLDISSATALGGTLTLGNGSALQSSTADAAMAVTGLTVGTGITIAVTGADEDYNSPIKLLSGLTEATISGLTFTDDGGAKYADIAGIITVSGISEAYNRLELADGTLSLISSAAPVEELAWLGGSGKWDATEEDWTGSEGSDPVAYTAGAIVTIGGTDAPGGTITVSGAQTAKSVTIASNGYTLTREAATDTLTIKNNLTVSEGVKATLSFIPTVNGSIVLNSGSTLEMTDAVVLRGNMPTLLGKMSEDSTGTLSMKGATTITDNNRLDLNGSDVTISGIAVTVSDSMAANAWNRPGAELVVESSLTVASELRMESNTTLNIKDGGSVTVGTLGLGHTQAGNPGHLVMEAGSSLTAGSIASNTGGTAAKPNVMEVNGGTLTITGATAFSGTGVLNVNVGAATIKNGESDMAFNHASTLTGTTISAQNDKTITVGGTGMTTTLVGELTTEGKVTLDGTLDTTNLTALNNSGVLTITGDSVELKGSVLNNTGTLATTGALTLTDAATVGGTVNTGSLSLTGANTFAAVTTGALTIADSLNVTGALTATSVTITNVSLTTTALTAGSFVGDSLALTVDEDAIASLMGTSATTLTLANIAGLTAATINGGDSFKVGSREYTIGVESGVVTITAEISDQFIWDATTEGSVWGDATSWEGDVQPTETSNVVFNGTGIADVTIGGNAVAGAVFVETDTNFITQTTGNVATGSVEISAGTLTIDEDVTVVSTGATSVVNETGNLIIKGALQTDTLAATGKDVQLSGTLTVDTEGSVNSIGGIGGDYGKLIVGTDAELTLLDVVEEKLTIAADSTVDELEVKHTGNLDAKGTFTVNSTADVAAGGVMTVAKDLTISDDLTNAGSITVGSAAAPATLATEDVTNKGTITVFNTMTSTGDVDNQAGATLDVKGNLTANTAGKTVTNAGNLQVGGTANVAALTTMNGSATTVAGNTTIAGALNNGGTLTVGTQAAPATLATGDVVNNGTITVFNTMTSTGDVTNNAGKTLDVKGTLTANTAGKTVNNEGTMTIGGTADVATLTTGDNATTTITGNATVATALSNAGSTSIGGTLTATNAAVTNEATGAGEKLTVTGALAADTLTTAAGATTEAKGGATIGTSLENHGKTTVTGNLVSADAAATTPGSATITNDATGTGEKLVVTGNVSGSSLTTETGATTEIGGTATLADGLTNKGKTTITGVTHVGGTMDNAGTLSTGALTAETLKNNGTLTVTGNATVKDLSSTSANSLTNVSGTLTIAQGGSLTDAGDITAGALDLSNLAATDKVTISDLKTNAVTLNALSSATAGLTVETLGAKTPGQKVTVSIADSIVEQIAALEESDTAQLVTVTSPASTGKLQLTTAAANKIATELDKKLLTYSISDSGVLTILDNALDKGMNLSENAQTGMDMVKEAYRAEGGTPTGALEDVTDALKAYRADVASGNPALAAAATAAAQSLTAAVSGSSIAAMGSALSGDVERQLRAIRNRTTTMGVNQAVINEDMPYVNAWVNAEGDYRKVAADGTMAGYKMMSWGGTVGMDVDFTPSFTCGLAATAMYGDFDADSTDSASGDIDTYYVSAFARYAKHRWTHTFVATAGLAETSMERTILGHTVKGDSDGMMFGGMYEVGYVFALDEDATTCLQPVLNVSYTHATLNGYDEDGANIALSAGDTELNKLTVGAGARLQSIIGENIYNRSSIMEARALVKFDVGDRQGETEVAFAGTGLPTHKVKSSETGAVGAEFGIGVTVPVGAEGGNLFMDASAEIRAEYTNVNATVGYRVNF